MQRYILSALLMTFLVLSASAQTASTSNTYTAHNEGWLVKLDEAYAESQRTGKPIMANFTGSDWCGWCIRLTKAVFVHDEFKEWADDNVVLLELDFPRRKALPQEIQDQNRSLQGAFKVRGFPTVWVFDLTRDENGKYEIDPLGKTGYTSTVSQFTDTIDEIIANKDRS